MISTINKILKIYRKGLKGNKMMIKMKIKQILLKRLSRRQRKRKKKS